jgi:hypothetical protein
MQGAKEVVSMRGAHVAMAAAAALLFASFASAQGLGDVAAREKEKRKAEAKTEGKTPAKVYTQDDLGASVAPAGAPDSDAAGDEAASGTPAEAGASGEGAEGQPGANKASAQEDEQKKLAQERWHRRLDTARKEEQAYREVIDKLQLELNDMSGGVYNPGRAAKISFLEENQKLLAQTQGKISVLEEEGRRNGYQ